MLNNMMVIIAGFTPIFGYLLSMLPLKRKPWFFIIEAVAAALFIIALFFPIFPIEVVVDSALRSLAMAEYILGFVIMLPVFSWKMEFPKALGLTLILFFLLTEIHEVYAFAKMYLGLFDSTVALQQYMVWFTPINHLYSVVSVVLAVKIAGIKRSSFWFMLSCFLIGLLIEVLIYPNLIYGVYNFWEFARRLYWIPILTVMFLKWRRKDASLSDHSA